MDAQAPLGGRPPIPRTAAPARWPGGSHTPRIARLDMPAPLCYSTAPAFIGSQRDVRRARGTMAGTIFWTAPFREHEVAPGA